MGVAIPLGYVEDRSSGALVVDGGLRFDRSKTNIVRTTFSSAGNRKTWTLSFWHKITDISNPYNIFTASRTSSTRPTFEVAHNYGSSGNLVLSQYNGSGYDIGVKVDGLYRDVGAWYHFVVVVDTTQSTDSNRVKAYVNGVQRTVTATAGGSVWPSLNADLEIGNNVLHNISANAFGDGNPMNGYVSNFYYINGQALDPSYFGYTDALTNTWRPKKFKPQATPNDGRTWNSTLSGTSQSVTDPGNAFNGNLSDSGYVTDGITFTPPSFMSAAGYVRSCRFYTYSFGQGGTIWLNGTQVATNYDFGGGGWYSFDMASVGYTLTSFKWDRQPGSGSNNADYIAAIEINGVILLNDDTTNIGKNGFYLPFDGNSPIGQDQSGRGNNWTPVNFGGSNTLEKATGALPILNTDGGGKVAQVGVFGSKVGRTYTVTVPGGTGGGFYLDGVQKPTLSFIRGATYTFDQSAASNSGHPLLFSTTQDGSTYSDGVTTSGTPGSSGAFTKITVPHNSADTLYYKCGNHSGMGASISVTTDERKADLYAWKNVLALPLVGIKSDFSNAINSGTSNKAITANGNAAASSVQSNFYGGSFAFDGSGDYIQTTIETLSGDFCIEGWWYPASSGQQTLFTLGDAKTSTGIEFYRATAPVLNVYGNDTSLLTATGFDYTLNKWQHYALTRSGTSLRLFKDGVQIGPTVTNSTSFDSTLRIGAEYYNSGLTQYLNGYVQDFRIYKGLAKYTQNFIPASTDPDILPDTPSGVSYSSNLTQITDGAVAFDGSGDWLTLSGSNDFVFGAPSGSSNDFTIEGFFYLSSFSASYYVLGGVWTTGSATEEWLIQIQNNGDMRFLTTVGTSFYSANISAGRWYHFAAVRSSSTITLYVNGVSVGSYTNSNSIGSSSKTVYFGTQNGGTWDWNGFISNLHIIKGTALYTANFTPPTAPISSVANTKLLCCKSNVSAGAATSSPNISGSINNGTVWSSTTNTSLIYGGSASMIFDGNATWSVGNYANFNPGAFTLFSGANVTANTSIRVYGNFSSSDNFKINGTTYTDNASGSNQWIVPSGVTYPITVNSIVIDTTGGSQNTISAVEIDGTILTDPVIVYGNAAATNFNPFTVNINTQRGKQSGWATFNPNQTKILGATDAPTLSDGNLTVAGTSSLTGNSVAGTIGVSSGKYYIEYTHLLNADANDTFGFGIRRDLFTGNYYDWEPYFRGTRIRATSDNGFYAAASGGSFSAITTIGDVIGIIFDIDNNYCAITVNGVIRVSSSSAGLSGYTWYPYAAGDGGGKVSANFGQKPFKFPPPAGFQPLALANTPRPTIVRPDQYVGVTTYTGTASVQSITGVGNFKPDFVWIKDRGVGWNHQLYDSVRGVGANKELTTSQTWKEGDTTNMNTGVYGYVSSLDASGFTLNPGSGGAGQYVNQSTKPYVAWAWKAGGNSNTYNINDVGYATASAAGLTAGSITPTGASVNTKSGFSIITYTGPNDTSAHSFSHGLGKKPSFILIKNRDRAFNWDIYHSSLGYNSSLIFTSATTRSGAYSAEPDSTLINVQWNYTTYQNDKYVAYCWTEIPGFSKFGSVTLSASSDDAFIWTGFRPRWFLLKGTGSTSNWIILDSIRDPFNFVDNELFANLSNTENAATSTYSFDFLSNGVKCRNQGLTGGFIYAAFAETPTQNLYGAQANAR